MDVPKITVNGKVYTMPAPDDITMKVWRKMTVNQQEVSDSDTIADALDKRLKGLAVMYDISADVLEDMKPQDIVPAYNAGAKYLFDLVFYKLGDMPKNAEKAGE